MKKIFCILSVFAIMSPAFAEGETPTPVAGTPTSVSPAGTGTTTTNPGYELKNGATTDTNAASAGYVKGAYNATIKAVNTVASIKQNTLTSTGNTPNLNYADGTSNLPVVTGVSAASGTVTVTKAEVTIPTSQPSGSAGTGRSFIWVQ